ncbi:F-box domain protein [Penicillium angulare]|uniref:F-box domain protein n=1 Tax=Penicillium angulare TaxID=116970 RepID=UPI002541008D|nr:F-box domain protein [Penicillium angulare]KAJ5273284.1 F-box domain protein [Penicillium angulare]
MGSASALVSSSLFKDQKDVMGILDFPTEIIDMIIGNLPISTLLSLTRASHAFEEIAMFHLESRLHGTLARESQDSFLHVCLLTPMNYNSDKQSNAWKYSGTASLSGTHYTLNANADPKPELAKLDNHFLVFQPAASMIDSRNYRCRSRGHRESNSDCCLSNNSCCRAGKGNSVIEREDIQVEWFEDFVQFCFKICLSNNDWNIHYGHNFVDKMIRIPRTWLDKCSEMCKAGDDLNNNESIQSLVWTDEETGICLQLEVTWDPEDDQWQLINRPWDDSGRRDSEWAADGFYRVALHRLWVPTSQFLLKEEDAIKLLSEWKKKVMHLMPNRIREREVEMDESPAA